MKRNRSKTFELKNISILRFDLLPLDRRACISRVNSLKLLWWNGFLEYRFYISMICDSFANEIDPRKYKWGKLLKNAKCGNTFHDAHGNAKPNDQFCFALNLIFLYTSKISPTTHRFMQNNLYLSNCCFLIIPSPLPLLLSKSPHH